MTRLVVALLLTIPTTASAADYQLDSTAWNGLGTIGAEILDAGCKVSAPALLDWSQLGARDVLWFIYPETPVDAARLKQYLATGGRALVADDFGAAAKALEALEIRRSTAPLDKRVPRYADNPQLPIAHSELGTEIGHAAAEIVANHPSVFETALPATFGFSPSAALVVEGQVGTGYFVALADPSVLINNMLELDGNRAFARALAHRLCQPGDRVLIFSHGFRSRGEPADDGSPFERLNHGLGGMNGLVQDDVTGGHVLAFAAIVFAVALLFAFAGGFPLRGGVAGEWTRFSRLLERDEPSLLSPTGLLGDHSLPSSIVRDEAIDRLSAALGTQVERMGPSELGRRVESVTDADTGRRAAELWRELHRLGWRPGERPAEPISARRFRRMHELATSLFDALKTRHNRGA